MARNVRLNLKGLSEFARLPSVHRAVNAKAQEMADAVESQGIQVGDKDGGRHEKPLPVDVYENQTTTGMRVDRAQARVVLAHASGLAVQAKNGALTKAASAAGLRVKLR